MFNTIHSQLIKYYDSAVERAQVSCRLLYSYNKSDSPAFSQVGSLQAHINDINTAIEEEILFGSIEKFRNHPRQILYNQELTSKEWDGAPIEVVMQCRDAISQYMNIITVMFSGNKK